MKQTIRQSYNLLLGAIWFFLRIRDLLSLNIVKLRKKPVHIIFAMVDHYEPGTRKVSKAMEQRRVNDLLEKYPKLADRHKDSVGRIPQRTWFFPPHYHRNDSLRRLVHLCSKGYGEIELHLHHGQTKPDTSENLERTILKTVEEYSRFGIFGTYKGRKSYAFIHGDWAFANSMFNKNCGVNDEISILKRTGCYADFTFPSCELSNPLKINSIIHAEHQPSRPYSYRLGKSAKKNSMPSDGLLLIQGPIYPYIENYSNSGPSIRINAAAIDATFRFTKKRVDSLIKAGIHVRGKSDWVFVKTHTHGAVDDKVVLGEAADRMFSYLETKYNDGSNYILHYVTAREMYNIIKAVEEVKTTGDPQEYRNYRIEPPRYNTTIDIPELSDELEELVYATYKS